MADRKETPDVLAEILVGESLEPQRTGEVRREPKETAKSRARRVQRTQKSSGDYVVISFQDYKGLRPRFENGKEYQDWMQLPLIHDYINILRVEGWELVSASAGERMYSTSDKHQLYFKRPR